jgi:hypothetical protein
MPCLNFFNKNISQPFSLSVLLFNLKFYESLGFSLSEHCEWGPMPLGKCMQREK